LLITPTQSYKFRSNRYLRIEMVNEIACGNRAVAKQFWWLIKKGISYCYGHGNKKELFKTAFCGRKFVFNNQMIT